MATPADVVEFRRFVLAVATRVAVANKEHGNVNPIGAPELAAIDAIKVALDEPAS